MTHARFETMGRISLVEKISGFLSTSTGDFCCISYSGLYLNESQEADGPFFAKCILLNL